VKNPLLADKAPHECVNGIGYSAFLAKMVQQDIDTSKVHLAAEYKKWEKKLKIKIPDNIANMDLSNSIKELEVQLVVLYC
jgi:hypothetical protein